MALRFRELADLVNESERFAKVLEPEAPFDAVSVIAQLPVRHLGVEARGFPWRERRNAASAGCAGFIGECIHLMMTCRWLRPIQ
jgi:hypothetical protein